MTAPAANPGLAAILAEVVPVVRATGRYIEAMGASHALNRKQLEIITKSHATDFVTQVDREAERRIVTWLLERYPDIGVLAEEGSRHNPAAARTWVLDPLDGTRNFIQGHPGYSVSLGLVEDGRPILGVVYDIEADDMYTAARGHGAWLNGRRLQVAGDPDVSVAMVGVGFPHGSRDGDLNQRRYLRLLTETAALRQGGAVARDLALVARGSLDAFWQPYLSPWDVAAGMVLVEEAGGQVETLCEGNWLTAAPLGIFAASASAFAPLRELVR